MRSMRIKARLCALAGTAVLCSSAAAAPSTFAASGNLPGGTSIEVDVTSPPGGTLIASPPGQAPLAGTAAIGEGVPVADTTLIYVLDVSGSTGAGGGCGGDRNGDGTSNTVLDCEIAAAEALNQQAIDAGTVDETGVVFFQSSATQRDVDPVAPGFQALTTPGADADANGRRDVEQTMGTATSFGGTNFEAAVQQACSLAQSASNPNVLVVFLSDGFGGGNALDDLPCSPKAATFETFAVGGSSSCSAGATTLQQIAAATGGSCTHVTNLSTLPDVVPGVIASKLTGLELSVDGGPATNISGSASPALPLDGPASTTFVAGAVPLPPGDHELCVTARGSDAGGPGSVTDCVDVTVVTIELAPSSADNELGTPGQTHTVVATVAAGPDGGVAGVPVAFEIPSGPNAGATHSAPTNAAGEASFTYAAAQGPSGLGTDTIEGCFTDDLGDEACDTATKRWRDTTAPAAACTPTTNPSGGNEPGSDNPKSGQNPDGFYELTATDAVDPGPGIVLADSGSSATFGPFASPTTIKLTQAPGAKPSQKPGTGAIDWHITIKGDGLVTATDASGNTSAPVACKVPPPPK